MVGADSVHGFVQSSKLQTTMWATRANFGLGTSGWAKGNGFLDGQSSIGVL